MYLLLFLSVGAPQNTVDFMCNCCYYLNMRFGNIDAENHLITQSRQQNKNRHQPLQIGYCEWCWRVTKVKRAPKQYQVCCIVITFNWNVIQLNVLMFWIK